jgi:catechol 2,3-dioxygenase-like lactoylglutathione lyase family enzyme
VPGEVFEMFRREQIMTFPALNHVAVTVRDMEISGPWYRALFEADPILDEHTDAGFRHLVWLLDGGTVFGIHQHELPAPDERFSEFRVGLDHVGFGCANRAELEIWMARLGELGVQHGGIVTAPYGLGLSFRDPDGIALEFFAPPS